VFFECDYSHGDFFVYDWFIDRECKGTCLKSKQQCTISGTYRIIRGSGKLAGENRLNTVFYRRSPSTDRPCISAKGMVV
jgi:hypothetical protein